MGWSTDHACLCSSDLCFWYARANVVPMFVEDKHILGQDMHDPLGRYLI